MLRASGFDNPLPRPWARRGQHKEPGASFRKSPLRVAAAIVVSGLVVGNAILVFRLTEKDATPARQPKDAGQAATGASAFRELRGALQSVQGMIRAEVEGSTLGRKNADSPRDGQGQASPVGSSPASSSAGSTSTGSGSSGSGAGSDSAGSGGSGTGGSGTGGGSDPAPDPGGEPSGGGGPGGGGGTGGGGGGDPGGGGSGGGGGGGLP